MNLFIRMLLVAAMVCSTNAGAQGSIEVGVILPPSGQCGAAATARVAFASDGQLQLSTPAFTVRNGQIVMQKQARHPALSIPQKTRGKQ